MKQEIHQLVQELIPLYDEVEEESKKIIDTHIKSCKECKADFNKMDSDFMKIKTHNNMNENIESMVDDITPFKLLNRFKIAIFSVLVVARLTIIGCNTNMGFFI
ncbi:zf-HC2 domain-containing protein [Pontibacillus litoralis]|uniref:Zinc-finger domain-containing protein n=1 Tax=Pontibacillus litoralis JSM 072002 TaxID=1385512 RepID=A0A0A5FWR4_9BACI|nr:zf-HC2 domain-containing protein [Pontibacillus litoralis]KGX84364.1 hypothetical protein N784_13590 [Pontibacillus litoralis JSM 072002]